MLLEDLEILVSLIQYSTVQYNTVQYSTVQCNNSSLESKHDLCGSRAISLFLYDLVSYHTILFLYDNS